MLNNHYHDTAS